MKNFLLVFFALAMVITTRGQSASDHMTFKGIPMSGSLTEFAQKLSQKGLTLVQTNDDNAKLTGDFAGYKDCQILLFATKETKTIYTVSVLMPRSTSWSKLETNYNALKAMLTQKYGSPKNVVEKFQGISNGESNDVKMYYLKTDQCTYSSTFETSNGKIIISLLYLKGEGARTSVTYVDRINNEIAQKGALDDL
ncbi:hypothetical protein [Alloprevotella tannerae]